MNRNHVIAYATYRKSSRYQIVVADTVFGRGTEHTETAVSFKTAREAEQYMSDQIETAASIPHGEHVAYVAEMVASA